MGVSEVRVYLVGGPYYKAFLVFGGLYEGSLIFVNPQTSEARKFGV